MEISEIKHQLHYQIDNAGDKELREMYGLVMDYMNSHIDDSQEWENIPAWQQERLMESSRQADAGMGKPVDVVIENIKRKYGI